MQVTEYNDVKVYNLSAGKSLPQFVEEAKKKHQSLRYNEDYRKRLDLIQDFEFNIASSRVKVSSDGEFIVSAGVYPPEVKIFEARELGMKCSRGLNSEVVDFLILSEDWKKLVFLLDDRTVEFHSQYGRHHRLRVPKAGRSLCYDSESCVLFVGGSSAEVSRLDLEGGTFLSPVALQKLEEVHCVCANPVLPVLSCAGNGGRVESYDLREPSRPLEALQICQVPDGQEHRGHVSCCSYSSSGMMFAAGTTAGLVRVYDVRSSKPLAERNHMNGYPIVAVNFHTRGTETADLLVGSADCKSIKIWDANNGALAASVESAAVINSLEFCPNSGLFFCGNDQPRVGVYFVPSLGLAPRWCSFLDSITEELEESQQKTVYEDYQFVTTDALDQLGATELIGTKFLQPYMHGYFMDHRLHARLKAAANPFAYEDYQKERIRRKLEQKRKPMRIRPKRKVEVNPDLHAKLEVTAEEGVTQGVSNKRKKAGEKAKALLADDRFQALFADPDFAIEEKGPTAESTMAPLSAVLRGSGSGGKRGKKSRT